MKIVIVVDKINSAIFRLAVPIKRHNPHLDIEILDYHPKSPDLSQMERAGKLLPEADIVLVSYWKSGEKLKEIFDLNTKPTILWVHNPYDL